MLGIFCLMLGLSSLALFSPGDALAGAYLSSAHGNDGYGVSRSSMAGLGYPKGLCAHCHEQHASVDGAEPEPAGGPAKYALFAPSFVSQTDNFCMKCHDNTQNIASSAIDNYSYSYRAGGLTPDFLTSPSILAAFSYSSPGSSHNLDDIKVFIAGQPGWNYSTDSNPCAACHNPHSAQRDPKTAARGWLVSRPSQHNRNNNTWGLWGDDLPTANTERMSDYIAARGGVYQAPYYHLSNRYEPDNSTVTNGSNLTDFVTFCTDCHNATNTIYSTPLARNLRTISWTADAHGGQQVAPVNRGANNNAPYGTPGTNYVLACTDCHEPHGSPNPYLLRPAVNGVPIAAFSNGQFWYFCAACHTIDPDSATHIGVTGGLLPTTNCAPCHSHGAGLAPSAIF